MIRHRRTPATVAVAVGLAAGAFGLGAPAGAHVTVSAPEARQGGYARLAFRVPTESATASTTRVEVVLPEDAPVASVSTMPVPGWTVTVDRRRVDRPVTVHGAPVDEVVSRITWTAVGDAAIRPGQFQEFPVSMGPLPEVGAMVFKSLQTYSDGRVVRWIEEPPAGGGEAPEHPAPVLRLSAATPAPSAGVAVADDDDDERESPAGSVAVGLGAAGLLTGLGGLTLGGLAFARTRRGRSAAA